MNGADPQTLLVRLFPLAAVGLSALALAYPGPFVALKPTIVPLLGVIMFGMGITLTAESFREVLRRPRVVALGTGLQFLLMPLFAFVVSRGLGLDPWLAAGLVLVGSCPGGTASNVICYLARGDVALSITLTTVSTLLAVAATPLLTWLYIGQSIPVPVWDMLWSVFKIVLVPVVLGMLVNRFGRRVGARLQPVFPYLSVAAIVLIIAIIAALNQGQLPHLVVAVVLAVVAHNLLGLLGGYWLARWLGFGERDCRTLAIEVGMQNSGLGVALALKYFTPAAALPGALFSIWHNLSGSLLAARWGKTRAE